jgi:hypothetical protein
MFTQDDVFATVDKYIGKEKGRPKLVNLIDMVANNTSVKGPPPKPGVTDPSLLRDRYDESINQMVKPEVIDPNDFKFRGEA